MNTSKATIRNRVLLIIMDGVGVNPSPVNNAVALAKTPNLDRIYASNPTALIEASGLPVGLPDGQMGNSEVGHLTLGCGCRLRQDLVKINDAITSGEFADNAAFQAALTRAKAADGRIHLVGLVSDGGVHSHSSHLLELVRMCGVAGVKPFVHMITDGRDTAPKSATDYLQKLEAALDQAGGCIASICGRYFAMDRDKRWERVQLAWQLLIRGEGQAEANASGAIESAWAAGETDEFIKPVKLTGYELPKDGDEWIFFNFRNDRPRELSLALADPAFNEFERGDFTPVTLTTLTRYHADYAFPVAFEKEVPEVTLGQVISDAGLAQFRSAETEKYPHVTFFFNGGREEPFVGEERLLVDSPKVATYDLQPQMSAAGICSGVVAALDSENYELLVVNFANGDMVGHTGVRDAVIQAVEVVDQCVATLVEKAVAKGVSVVVTADHGNADMLLDPVTGEPHTQHTTFPVPCAVIDPDNRDLVNAGDLTSIAPTILELMGLPKPANMTGRSLLM